MATYDDLMVDIGNAPDDDQGDPLRTAFDKINQRFAELRIFANGRGGWAPSTVYTANPNRDWVIFEGEGYLATSNHTSGATFAADLAAGKWVGADALLAIQAVDVLRADLASTAAGKGAELVAFKQLGAGAADREALEKMREFSISPEDFGGVGDNVADDTAAMQSVAARIRQAGGGTIRLAAGKTYKVLPTGGAAGAKLFDFFGCKGVKIEGNGARILTGNATAVQRCFDLPGTTDVIFENLHLESGYASLDGTNGIDWIVPSQGAKRIILQNVSFKYGRVGFVPKGEYAGEGDDSDRVRDIVALNLSFESVYYSLNFQGAGDNFFGRGIYTRNCGRSYFAYNCRNHDVWIDSQQGGPFSDVLLKIYGSTAFYSRLENIKIVYTSAGRFAGAANQGADEAMVALDFQLADSNPAPCFAQGIDITFNVEPNGVSRNQSLFVVRKYDGAGSADTTGSRGHQLINMTLSGVGRSLQNLLTDSIRLFTRTPDNWAGEYVSGVHVNDMNLGNTSGQVAVAINGSPIAGPCSIKRVTSSGTLSRSGTNGKPIAIEESSFANYTAQTQAPQPYTPTWTAETTNPSVGNGTVQGSYTVHGKLCTAQIFMSAGSTTNFGSGVWSFSLPFTHSGDAIQSVGSAFALDSGTAFYSGACTVAPGSNTAQLVLGSSSGNYTNGATPFTWANGDFVRVQITYPIA